MLVKKDEILRIIPENIPQELKDLDQWSTWRAEPSGKPDGRLDKIPYSVAKPGFRASSTDPMTWCDYDSAYAAYAAGIFPPHDGLLFACGNGIGGVDLDSCVDRKTGKIDARAMEVIEKANSYTELSVSGTGVRIFMRLPAGLSGRGNGIELYSDKRFLSVTGHHLPGTPTTVNDRTHESEELRENLLGKRRASGTTSGTESAPGTLPSNVTALGITDDEVIARCRRFEGFDALWQGDASGYESASNADMALAGYLAFACGPDEHDRVERIMRRSGLTREKWDRPDYLRNLTIPKAFADRSSYYDWGRPGPQEESASENNATDQRPVVVLTPETDQTLSELEGHLAGHIYQRNRGLVRLDQAIVPRSSDSIIRPPEAIMLTPVKPEQVQRLMSRHVIFKKPVSVSQPRGDGRRKHGLRQVPAPANLAKLLVNSNEWERIPSLIGITNSPFLSTSGQVVQKPGYDPASGYLFVDNGFRCNTIPVKPTPQQVQAAVDFLRDLVCDFPFKDDNHEAAWMASLLTVAARPAIHGPVPMLWCDANKAGSGKTKLARLIGRIVQGYDPTEISFTADDTEMENRLAAVCIAADRFVLFDNVTSSTKNSSLERFLTSRTFGVRAFFNQKMLRLQNTVTLAMTGNNLILRGDLSRRVIQSRLVSDLELPQFRTGFRHPDVEEYATQNRGPLLAAALTILRAHAAAGYPAIPGLHPIGSFPDWERIVRHALLRTGLADPVATQMEVVAEDEDLVKLEHVLRTWHAYDPALTGTCNRLVEAAMDTDRYVKAVERRAFLEALREWTGTPIDKPPCAKALSYRFRAAKDRCVGGFRVVRDSIRTGSGFRWAVVQDAQ